MRELYIKAVKYPNSPISIDGIYKNDLTSGDSLNIKTVDQNDNPIIPISGTVSGGVATVKIAQPIICTPTNVEIKNSDESYSQTIQVENCDADSSVIIPDSSIEVDGLLPFNLPATESLLVKIKDQNDVPITPISRTVIGGIATVKINVPICPPDTTQWILQFLTGTADITVVANTGNIATFASGSGVGIGTLNISTDGITYGAISYPFTPISGITYYFKRSTTTGFAEYKIIE